MDIQYRYSEKNPFHGLKIVFSPTKKTFFATEKTIFMPRKTVFLTIQKGRWAVWQGVATCRVTRGRTGCGKGSQWQGVAVARGRVALGNKGSRSQAPG
jgi:hypothetical protein